MSELTQQASRDNARGSRAGSTSLSVGSPTQILCLTLLLCTLLLSLPFSLPLGPMYWDVIVYLDGGSRVLGGQVPSVDFFAPVGPLEYWLFAGGMALFPRAQPVLLSQWMLLVVTAPPMLLVLHGLQKRSMALAVVLLAPFLLFQLAPINVEQHSTFPGVDGYGIYNRHVTEVLYVLAAAFMFETRQRRLLAIVAWCCTALFLLKITGFVAGGLLCLVALLSGRVSWRTALGAAAAFAVALAALELVSGVVTRYVLDIAELVALNEDSLLPRFLQAASIHFNVLGLGAALLATIAVLDRARLATLSAELVRRPGAASLHAFFDTTAVWLGAALFAGLFFETQNTGGQAFIFLIPILARIACEAHRAGNLGTVAVLGLVVASAATPMVNVAHRTARALIGQVNYEAIGGAELRSLGQTSQRPEVFERAEGLIANYRAFDATYEDFAARGMLPSFTLYSDLDFQSALLLNIRDGVRSVRAYEEANGVRFETIMALNFVNPFPYLLDRKAPRLIAIGADPFRAVPPPDAETVAAVRATDLALFPTCPVTIANQRLRDIYAEGLRDHIAVTISPCWTGYVRPELLAPSN